MAFYTCPYCDGTEETPVSSAFHVCDQNKVKDKIKALEDRNAELMEAARQEATAKIHEAVASYDAVCAQNADLLAALKPFADYFEGDLGNVGGGTLVAPPFPLQRFKDAKAAIVRATGERKVNND
jgi:hypothetical protein